MKKIGILTGGGDCPGLNAVIRGVVERCAMQDVKVFGYHEGWRGVIEQDGHWMDTAEVESIQGLGGTILRTSRTNVMKMENGPALVRRSMESLGLECIVAIGGDDTLGVANQLVELGLPMIGVPKTIDNDLNCTDYTFGFDTAANMAMRAMDDLSYHGFQPFPCYGGGDHGAQYRLDCSAERHRGQCECLRDS